MEYIIRGLTFALIPIIVNGILVFLRQPKKTEKGKVHLPKFFVILGTVTSAVCLIPAIITAFSDEGIWLSVLFLVCSLLGTSLIVGFVNCRISYDEEGFVYKTFLGVKRKVTYDQVTAIKENMHECYIYIGKHRVMVDELSIGGKDFIKLVKKKYSALHNGKFIPKICKTKYDIFNGHVNDVTGFWISCILSFFVICAFLGSTIYYTYLLSTEKNTIEQSVSFISCDEKDNDIVLISSDNQIYKIQFIDEQFNVQDIKTICNGETFVTTYSEEFTSDDEADYYSVKAIVHNGTYLLSFEETNRLHRQEYWPLVFLSVFICLLLVAAIVTTVIVGRNPDKFSKKVVRLFFKDGYIKY